jgi:hypothetical protein
MTTIELHGYTTPIIQGKDAVVPLVLASGPLALRCPRALLAKLAADLAIAAGAGKVPEKVKAAYPYLSEAQERRYQQVFDFWVNGRGTQRAACKVFRVGFDAFAQWVYRRRHDGSGRELRSKQRGLLVEHEGRWVSRIWLARQGATSRAA